MPKFHVSFEQPIIYNKEARMDLVVQAPDEEGAKKHAEIVGGKPVKSVVPIEQ